MKKLLSVLLASLLLLSLTACGNNNSASFGSGSLPDASGDALPQQEAETLSPVTTEEEVRALYAADLAADPTSPPVLSITEYQGDFLVQLGWKGDNQWLDWVYGQSGIRRRMVNLYQELLSCEILSSGCIKAVIGGANSINGVPFFPHVARVSLNLLYDELGQPRPYDSYSSDSNTTSIETYWASAGESYEIGMGGRREAIRSAQLDAGGVTIAFAPLADGSDFIAAYCEIPWTEISLSEDGLTLTVTMYDTYLDSGKLKADANSEFLDFLAAYGSLYPEDFPEGELEGSCLLVQSARLQQQGDNAVLTLNLNHSWLEMANDIWSDGFFQFTASSDYTGIADTGPYLRIQLRATNELFLG